MIVITLVLWMWKTEVLLTCSAILETVGIAGALGEGYLNPTRCWGCTRSAMCFQVLVKRGDVGFEKLMSQLCHDQCCVSNSAFSSVPTR